MGETSRAGPSSTSRSRSAARALVLGDVNVDITLALDEVPSRGGEGEAHGRSVGGGGGGLNAAVALRSLGVDVSLVGSVGSDALADVAMETAKRRGVDLSRIQRCRGTPTGTCVVVTTPDGERTLLTHRGANAELSVDGSAREDLVGVRLLLLFGYAFLASPQEESARSFLDGARESGCLTAMDLGLSVARRTVLGLELARSVDIVLLNEQELLVLTSCGNVHEGLNQLFARGARMVVVKQGARGCLVAESGQRTSFVAPCVRAVDTTGCGDAFSAAFGWMWATGRGLATCASVANTVGSLTATGHGAAGSVPSESQVRAALARTHLSLAQEVFG